jgi:hypothetical protein
MSSFILIYCMKTTGTNQCRHNQPQTSVSKLRLIGSNIEFRLSMQYGREALGCKGEKPGSIVGQNERNVVAL